MRITYISIGFLMLLVSSAAQPGPCKLSTVSINTKDGTVNWDLRFPQDVGVLKLGAQGDSGTVKWKVDPAIARFHGNDLVRTTEDISSVRLTAVLPENFQRQDRVYAPALFLKDHSVAVLSTLFNFSAEDEKSQCTHFIALQNSRVGTGDKWNQLSVNSDTSLPGYVVFGSPNVKHLNPLILVTDKGVPAWVSARVEFVLRAVIRLYITKMEPQPLPPIIIYSHGKTGAMAYYWGDRLPDSITLGLLGGGWRVESQSLEDELDHFLAHEVFHVWNGRINFVGDGDSLLAVEGGAELASIFALSKVTTQPASFVLDKVSDALNQCQFDLAYGSSLHDLLQSEHPGRVPYHCGMILMFAATASADVRPSVSEGFFKSWKALLLDTSGKKHLWSDLVAKNHSGQKLVDLDRAVSSKGQFVEYLEKALAEDGYALVQAKNLSDKTKKQLATVIMANLMQLNCAGQASFWFEGGGFKIDDKIRTCKALRPGATVTSLLGEKPWNDPVHLIANIESLCKIGNSIPVGYSSGGVVSLVKCKNQFPHTPMLVRIVRK